MTRLFPLPLVVALCPAAVQAQHGTVLYDFTETLEHKLPEGASGEYEEYLRELAEQFPSSSSARLILTFNVQASLVRTDPDYADSLEAVLQARITQMMEDYDPGQNMGALLMALGESPQTTMDEGEINLDGLSPPEATYVNFDEETYTQARTFLGRRFLVRDDRETLSWKFSGEERSFLGHRIVKATAQQDTVMVEAWFTPDVPAPASPALYGGLPGLILILSLDGGQANYTAIRIDLESLPKVARPTDGQAVTLEEFHRIVRGKVKEMETKRRDALRGLGF